LGAAVYPRLFYWRELDRGGHFAALEVPELFTEELRRCFRSIWSAIVAGKRIYDL
jgi:hypothetical protein